MSRGVLCENLQRQFVNEAVVVAEMGALYRNVTVLTEV
jgi:hypothetical protein